MLSRLDHIVIAADNYEQGVLYIREKLGVEIPKGGQHKFMGTQNSVMALGENIYLEVISIDPTLNPPIHPRWFGLDDPQIRNILKESPKLLTWAINSKDLNSTVQSSAVSLGNIISASRNDLQWKVAFRQDGTMPASGFIPLCIEWEVDFHPAVRMVDFGWKLKSLQLFHHHPEWLGDQLEALSARDEVIIHEIEDGQTPYLEAIIVEEGGLIIRLR
ncbi:MAG: VOC family protein [Gammaproteobacteria bacterium]|nr:VOC family protein [Gammaproteobacteria bacterium]MCY4218215.1 VOC family protein [Gammaproteobacteria bacterium]MCY4274859.1 VOC family protein [Gammaproteobacteria bacterium]